MNRLFAVAVLAVFVLAPLVSAQETHPTSKTELSFSTPVVVGGTTLSPGRYRFECKWIDGQHVMVVMQKGKEVARIPCTPVTLESKVDETGYRTILREDVRVLTEIRIKGETIAHKLAAAN
jgi:hypothetical protein